MSFFESFDNFLDDLTGRFTRDLAVNRGHDSEVEINNERNAISDEVDASAGPKIVDVDFLIKPNALNHNCDKYEIVQRERGAAIIRRGGNFSLEVEFNVVPELKKTHDVRLIFSFGNRPRVHNGTQAVLHATGKQMFNKNHAEWDVRVEKQEGRKVTFEVQVPTDAAVGIWKSTIDIKLRTANDASRHIFRSDTLLYILFNPWNKHDGAYMPDEEKKQEYVLADVGKIWVGNYPFARGRHWVFGQFDDAVLPACILLLERSGLSPAGRGDPIRVSRAISKMVNVNDEAGVIHGRWDGKYEDGTSPSTWTGSIKILEDYITSKNPIKYGQCWVFAGVTNTVCRAIGLPARVVSNFASAHDTNFSLTIDEYVDEKGDELTRYIPNADGINDSVWNFHVWNDVWMARPDLPEGFGGWQVIDATPQETSDGSFQCGPASHEAIRTGQVQHKYDVPFVIAEVNADVVHWQKDDKAQGGFKKLESEKSSIGRQVLTKKPGPVDRRGYYDRDREDITLEYKPEERTVGERAALLAAARRLPKARHAFRLPSEAPDDVKFVVKDIESVQIGKGFTVVLEAKNTSEQKRTVSSSLTSSSMYYPGAFAYFIKKTEKEFELAPGETKNLPLQVDYSDYGDKLVEHAMIRNVGVCNVKETGYAWVGADAMEVQKPDIEIEVASEAVVGKPLRVKLSFVNPLPSTLRNCKLVVDGPDLTRPKPIEIGDVSPHGEMVHNLVLHPRRSRLATLVVTFNSTELYNLTGSAQINVVDA